MQEVTGEEQLFPQKATVLGPVMVIPLEYPQITCSSIDVILPQPGDKQEDKLLARLAAELVTHSQDRVIAYRKHYRWVQTFEPFPLEKPGENIPHLQERGVYLVTGGLGGIGMVIARHLARSVNARLILTGRSPLPQEEQWQEWLAKHSPQDKTSRKIRRILELKETGTEVMVCSADVANMNQMKAVITAAEKQLGTINGIFHAAGVPGGGMIQLKTREQANKVLAPKIKGTLVLNKIFQHHDLDFFILCSSINSILPLLGQVDYYAANAFMDAFAYYKTSTGVFTVSINWDTWQELGMAVEAARQLIEPGEPPPGVMHPLLHRRITEEPQLDIYVTYFSLDKHWVLEEHKISQSGKGLVPGVTYLEMAREAMAKHGGNGAVEIQEVYFFNPLVVGENEEKEVRFILKKQASSKTGRENNVFDFQVQSRTGQGEDNWQKHALGKIQALERPGEPVIHDIGKIAAACNTKKTDLSGNTKEDYTRKGLLIFGPRWHNLKQLHLGENQGLAHLELSERFAPEVEVFKLHPALLDSAAGFLFGHVGNSAYIPFSYQRITLKSPLPNKVFSYSRLVKDQGDELRQEALKFDITIMDEQGVELVDIKEFTMLQVSEEVKAKIKVKEQAAAAPEFLSPTLLDTGSQELTHRQKEFLKNGILPSEGIEVFNRILSSALPQVVVSTLDLPTRFEESPGFINVLSKETLKENKDKSTVAYQPRPTLSTAYAAPKTSIEKTIANVWQELLGIQQIGIHDNFFDLGGDSLNIVQLNTKLKKVLKREIPVAVMFSYLTIHSFVHYLNQKEQGQGNANEEIDRSDEIEKSKKRMKAVKRQR
jgi:NAD(P)-dependent dehydrogenase (short-subunit alcohol dehydrogenase family)/acyl carrier protein